MKGTSFKATNLLKSNFSGADIRGVDFTDAYLKDNSFKDAIVDRFTKTSEFIDWKKLGAKFVEFNSNTEIVKEFELLVLQFESNVSSIDEIEKFLVKNPSLDLNEISKDSTVNYILHSTLLKILSQGRLDFFDCLVKRGFRFDFNFLRFTDSLYMSKPNFLRTALLTNREDILRYVLKFYSPYKFSRIHLSTVINDLSPNHLDMIVKLHPHLLSDESTQAILHDEDPLYQANNPEIIKHILELQISRDPTANYPNKFLINFEKTLDFRYLDIPLSFGFDFSTSTESLISIVANRWDFLQNKVSFLKELKLRTYSPSRKTGLRILDDDEIKRISWNIGYIFKFKNSGISYLKDTGKYLDILSVYIALFGIRNDSNLLKGFLSTGGGANWYWYFPEYELAFKTILDFDPNPDLQFASKVVQNLQMDYAETTPQHPIYKSLLALIQSRTQKP